MTAQELDGPLMRTYCLAITNAVDDNDTIAKIGEKLDLVSPSVPEIREAVDEKQRRGLGISLFHVI